MRTHYWFGRKREGDLTTEDIALLLAEARTKQAALRELPIDTLLLILERVGAAWADPDDPRRKRVLDELPAAIGFSREMVTLELQGLTTALTRPYLEAKLRAELGRLDAQDLWHRKPGSEAFQKAAPRGVVLHVASGNVSTTGVLSLIEGLLARNVNILKVASNAPLMPLLFAETVKACDPTGIVAESLAVLSWSGGGTPLHVPFQREADAIVVWGGDEVLDIYRQGLGAHTRLIGYGPKVSAGFVGAEALTPAVIEATAEAVARDVSLWDQNACSSPQLVYLEDESGDRSAVKRFVAALTPALESLAASLPMGALDLHERAEITKERELALSDALLGVGELVTPDGGTRPDWTVIVDYDPAFRLSPLFRTIILKPVAALREALGHLAPYRHYLQTAGLAVSPTRAGAFADALVAAGALRVTRLGEMSGGQPGEPHDGVYGLGELVKWVSLDTPEAADAFDGTAFMSAEQGRATAFARRQRLVESLLPHAPYYRSVLAESRMRDEIDWQSLPLLTRGILQANTPPAGSGLLTAPPDGGHWLRSGGSTGDPKLSIYSFEDYEDDMWRAARGAHAAGLRKGDKVANLFFAGDLYGSFLSLNRVLELIGCNSFPFTNHAPIESVLTCLRDFQIDTVIGLSSWVQAVLAEAMKNPGDYCVRRVLYTGEPFHAKDAEALKLGLGVESVRSIGYGGVDAGPMGYQCAFGTGGVHHLHADHVHMELIDPDTLKPVAGEAEGEIVITSLNRRLMPLLRYRVGDRGRWVPGACPCGSSSPRFELLGRLDDRVRLVGFDFHYGDVQHAVTSIDGLCSTPRVELAAGPGGEGVSVYAELSGAEGERDRLAAAMRTALLDKLPRLADVVLHVEVLPAGSLERVGRTGKIVRLADLRREPT